MAEKAEEEEHSKDHDSQEEESPASSANSEEASSSGEEEEQQPVAHHAPARGKPSPLQPAQSKAEGRKRVNRFPKIPRSERCGRCENCLNPQRKKACIVARKRMEQQLQAHNSTSSSGPVAAPSPLPAQDPFTRSLTSILSSSGGVMQERHVAMLLQLVQRATTKPHRTALLVVLQLSSPEVLRQAVAHKLLLELQRWLIEFIAEGKQSLVQKALACLDKLPITLAALQPPCQLGKIVGRLRKHESFGSPVTEPAKRLVVRWKAMVEQGTKAAGNNDSGSVAPFTAGNLRTSSSQSLDKQASVSLKVVEDGDLFKSTDKQQAGIKDAVSSAIKAHTIKMLPAEGTRSKPADSSWSSGSSAKPNATVKQPASSLDKPSDAGSSSVRPADACKVSISPFTSLGNLGSSTTVLGGAISGGLGATLPTVGVSTAKERAAAACQRVPSPEPEPRRLKLKKVTWRSDEELVGVRWFCKEDPPSAVQHDVERGKLSSSNAGITGSLGASPPVFELAAKKEHLSEAAALRRHREEEDQERLALVQRLAQMVPMTAWLSPVNNDTLSDMVMDAMAAPPAHGEDSTEAGQVAARRPLVAGALAQVLLDTPEEPALIVDHGHVQPAEIVRIPLSLEAAVAWQQQQQQHEDQHHNHEVRAQLSLNLPGQTDQKQHAASGNNTASSTLPNISVALAQLAASGAVSSLASCPVPRSLSKAASQPLEQCSSHPRAQEAPGQQMSTFAGQLRRGGEEQQVQQAAGRQPAYSRRLCRYFNTPKGCYMGDRCNFAHCPAPSSEPDPGARGKRPAEGADAWRNSSKRKKGPPRE